MKNLRKVIQYNSGIMTASCDTPKKGITANPSTIKVYRTKAKSIDTVGFYKYCKSVTVNEVGYDWDQDALNACALAIKNYGISRKYNKKYPDLEYDVKDTEADQVYDPTKAETDKCNVVPMDFTGEDNESLVDVTLNDESVKLCVDATGYEKTVKIPKKYMSEEGKTETAGTADRFFELQNNMIVLAYRIYVDTAGNSIGDVRQEIQFDESGNRLVYGKTSYMTATEAAEKRPYELCE